MCKATQHEFMFLHCLITRFCKYLEVHFYFVLIIAVLPEYLLKNTPIESPIDKSTNVTAKTNIETKRINLIYLPMIKNKRRIETSLK